MRLQSFEKIWIDLLIDICVSKNRQRLESNGIPSVKSDLVDSIITGGLLLRSITIIDEALVCYLDENNLRTEFKNPKLYHRLVTLNKLEKLVDYDEIDKWRIRRNDVGHKIDERYTWQEVDRCLDSVYTELNNLNILNSFPTLDIKKTSKRLSAEDSSHDIEIEHTVSIHDNGKVYRTYKYKTCSG